MLLLEVKVKSDNGCPICLMKIIIRKVTSAQQKWWTCWTNPQSCMNHDQEILSEASHHQSGKMVFPKKKMINGGYISISEIMNYLKDQTHILFFLFFW